MSLKLPNPLPSSREEHEGKSARKTLIVASSNPSASPMRDETAERRSKVVSRGQYTFYKNPLMLVKASGQYCFDEAGRRYLDAYANVAHVGHCHPQVVQAAFTQMSTINSNTRYLHPNLVRMAELLLSKMPPGSPLASGKVFFVNSGSEANDLALRLSRVHTKNSAVICLEHAYHGTTATCTGISSCLSTGQADGGCPDFDYCARDIEIVPVPDTYRGLYRDKATATGKYLSHVDQTISKLREKGQGVAAYIAETIQGVGGQVVYPEGYLSGVYERVRAAGGLCIADEVQVGFARVGSKYWAFEEHDVIPDILTLGKPIGDGFPMAAVVVRSDVAASFDSSRYFNTFGGNPVACAVGIAVMSVIDEEGLQANAKAVGDLLMEGLLSMQTRNPVMGDVRGRGLFLGVELIKPSEEELPIPDSNLAKRVMERTRELGALIGLGGPGGNVLRIKPPMCITLADADDLLRILEQAIAEESAKSIVPLAVA